MKVFMDWAAFFSNLMTIGASGIAIYLFTVKRKAISTVFNMLMSYTTQLTLSELRTKLDQLNDFRVENDRDEIVNVLHDISGQLKGNPKLSPHFTEIILRIGKVTVAKGKITEPSKRAIVSEIRERVRHVDILNIQQMSGDEK